VSFTFVPAAKEAAQVGLQAMPAGLLVIVPDPLPVMAMVTWYEVAAATEFGALCAESAATVKRVVHKINKRRRINDIPQFTCSFS